MSEVYYFLCTSLCLLAVTPLLVDCKNTKKNKKQAKPMQANGMAQRRTDGMNVTGANQQNAQGNQAPIAAPQAPKAPAVGGVAGTYDPNYQTLANMDGGQVFGADRAGGAKPAAAPVPQAPQGGGAVMAGTHDPQYQTLNVVGGDVFDKK